MTNHFGHLGRGTSWYLRVMLSAVVLGVLSSSATAKAAEHIVSFTSTASTSQAGGHPDITTSFTLEHPGAPEAAQNVSFDTPEGFFGNPLAVTQCTTSDFALDQCPSSSQVGITTIYANYEGDSDKLLGTAPIFDLEPGERSAMFAFIAPVVDIPITIPVSVRYASDYGLRFTVSNITESVPLATAELTFWGFPALLEHDGQRFPKGSPGDPAGCVEQADTSCIAEPTEADIPAQPLIDNPTRCTGQPLPVQLEVSTYQDPEHLTNASTTYPSITGCEDVTFKPDLFASPTTEETDAASGMELEMSDPQFEGFAASPSELKDIEVIFPEGFTINPDAADGQTDCPDSQAHFHSTTPAACPDSAKIGTFAIHSVALNGTLNGSVYIGEPQPGHQYRLFMFASGFGIEAKLVGTFDPNPMSGQVTAHFEDLPQVPFDTFDLHLFSGERALMASPTACSIYAVQAVYYPWDEVLPYVRSLQNFGLRSGPHGSACPGEVRPFSPTLAAGTSNPVAGAHSAFSLKLNREDGDQYLGKLNFTMPPGLTADLHGVTYCPETSIAAAAHTLGRIEEDSPSCPASSQIGTSNVAAGPGSHPFHAVGKIYMAGPFEGAPLSLVAVTPALAGPYDYGTVVVRVALHVDPVDAHVVADSETVPEIIGGIPIRMREIRVNIDKPNFIINPTNCSPFSVKSQGIGDEGTVASFSSYFQVANCVSLPFAPNMAIRQLGGHKATRRSQDPGMQFDLRTREGEANIKSLAVTLPKAFEIDQRHLGNICSKAQLETERCAGRQEIGTVSTETPLLEQPLTGPAYAVSGYGKLPHVAFILGGQVTLVPQAESSSVKGGHLRTVVPVIPDAPIGHFRLTLFGGKQGYLVNTRGLCVAPAVTTVEYTAQSGKTATQHVKTQTACGAQKSRTKRHASR